MKKLFSIPCLLIVLLSNSLFASAQTLNGGTVGGPSIACFQPPGAVLIDASDFNPSNGYKYEISNQSGKYYVFDSDVVGTMFVEKSDNITIDFCNHKLEGTQGSANGVVGIKIEHSDDVVVKNGAITKAQVGLYAEEVTNFEVSNLSIDDVLQTALILYPCIGHCVVRDNVLKGGWHTGAWVGVRYADLIFENNNVTTERYDSVSKGLILDSRISDLLVHNNEIKNPLTYTGFYSAAIDLSMFEDGSNISITENLLYGYLYGIFDEQPSQNPEEPVENQKGTSLDYIVTDNLFYGGNPYILGNTSATIPRIAVYKDQGAANAVFEHNRFTSYTHVLWLGQGGYAEPMTVTVGDNNICNVTGGPAVWGPLVNYTALGKWIDICILDDEPKYPEVPEVPL